SSSSKNRQDSPSSLSNSQIILFANNSIGLPHNYSKVISQRTSLSFSSLRNARFPHTSSTWKEAYPRGMARSISARSERRSTFCLPFQSSFLKMGDRIRQVLSPENFPRIPCFPGRRLKLSLPHSFFLNSPFSSSSRYQ